MAPLASSEQGKRQTRKLISLGKHTCPDLLKDLLSNKVR
jgi:hypothetical protein